MLSSAWKYVPIILDDIFDNLQHLESNSPFVKKQVN